MNILIDINHPCHVHIFKNFYSIMTSKGHNLFVTCKKIPTAISLLNEYNIPFQLIDSRSDSILGKALAGINQGYQMRRIVTKANIDIAIGSSMNIAHVSWLSRMNSLVIDDDDDSVEPLFAMFVHPFADVVISPISVIKNRKTKNAYFYNSYHELAYLHPDIFTPNPGILSKMGVREGERYFILRFNAFKAHHDINEHGLSLEQKRSLMNLLLEHGKVFISSEGEIENEFKQFQISIPASKMHDALAYATIFLGDSQTMTSEAAVLGTPSIRCNTFVRRISYLDEQEDEYGLTFGFKPDEFLSLLEKVKYLLTMKELKQVWEVKRNNMLAEKVNFTNLLVDIVSEYPQSLDKLIKR